MAQGGWKMTVNSDRSPFNVRIQNTEMTFVFNPNTDTLTFSMGNNKAMKIGFVVEFALKNNSKVVFTTNEKFFNFDKTQIVVPLAEVWADAKTQKLPNKPKFIISIKEKTAVKEKLNFEFKE